MSIDEELLDRRVNNVWDHDKVIEQERTARTPVDCLWLERHLPYTKDPVPWVHWFYRF